MSKESQVVSRAKRGHVSRGEPADEQVVGRERDFQPEQCDLARLLPRFHERDRRLTY